MARRGRPRKPGPREANGWPQRADLQDNVERRLEDAGRTLMMLPMPADGMPAGDRAAWPSVLQDFWDIAGPGAEKGSVEERLTALAVQRNVTRLGASSAAIGRLDEVLTWLLAIDKLQRKVVFARMMTHPVSERPRFSWADIADSMGSNRSSVRRWHAAGLQAILEHLVKRGGKKD